MVIIGCARACDQGWLRELVERYRLQARLAEGGERWDVFVDEQGNVHGGGQVITCGLDRRCTLTARRILSILQNPYLLQQLTVCARCLDARPISTEILP